MNVFDFAMKMEEDGKSFYERLAAEAGNEGLKTIFTRLAEDEKKHYEIFQSLKGATQAASMEETKVLEDSRNIFQDLLGKEKERLNSIQQDLEGYRYAMKLEAESYRLYEDAAKREKNEDVKNLLRRVAEEEHKHFLVVENVYNFFNAPNQYLAWREFSNLDEFRNFGRDVDL